MQTFPNECFKAKTPRQEPQDDRSQANIPKRRIQNKRSQAKHPKRTFLGVGFTKVTRRFADKVCKRRMTSESSEARDRKYMILSERSPTEEVHTGCAISFVRTALVLFRALRNQERNTQCKSVFTDRLLTFCQTYTIWATTKLHICLGHLHCQLTASIACPSFTSVTPKRLGYHNRDFVFAFRTNTSAASGEQPKSARLDQLGLLFGPRNPFTKHLYAQRA